MKTHPILLASILMLSSATVLAAGCDDYPYTDGLNIEDVQGGTKILATASSGITFDDIDSVRDARDEAILEAKAQISRFLTETIQSDETINKAVNETKSLSGNGKAAQRQEVVERVKKLRNTSSALLRGVVMLAECHTQGREVRVSVGIKPETIRSAGNVAGSMGNSLLGNAPAVPVIPSEGVESYSHTKRLKNF